MVKKQNAKSAPTAEAAKSVKDSAQQIWQAGLAAFTRAQSEGGKAFDSLVKEGMEIQRKTQSAAEGKIAKVSPGAISPRSCARWIMDSAGRSFTEPAGLLPSSLPSTTLLRAELSAAPMRCRATSGVLPMASSSVG